MDTGDRYRRFAEREARGQSPSYERLARSVAEDADLLRLLDELPEPKRQPNLLFAAARFLGGPVDDPDRFLEWTTAAWPRVAATMLARRTQTNEAARCAVLLPVLARLPQPLALIEVGASAGLCLHPDAYRYSYGDHRVGPAESPVELTCAVEGAPPLPERMPEVVWRVGLDLNPLDVSDEEDLRWLTALVWPEQHERRERLLAAADIARAAPAPIHRGDLLTDLPALAATAPRDATLVVFHSAVLAYVPAEVRAAFAELVGGLPGHWISNEAAGVLPGVTTDVPAPDGPAHFLLALDSRPLAWAAPHGQALHWFAGPTVEDRLVGR